MVWLPRLLSDFVARIDRIADQDADPAALTGLAGRRRHGLPVVRDAPGDEPVRDVPVRDLARNPTPEEAQRTLDELRADQHRRMRARRRSIDE